MDLLLAAGANPNVYGEKGRTVLHTATWFHVDTTMIKSLLIAGADVNAHDNDGITPLMNVVQFAHNNAQEAIELLLNAGADINARDIRGRTPLMHASIEGKADSIRVLIKLGAKVELNDCDDNTAVQLLSGFFVDKGQSLRNLFEEAYPVRYRRENPSVFCRDGFFKQEKMSSIDVTAHPVHSEGSPPCGIVLT